MTDSSELPTYEAQTIWNIARNLLLSNPQLTLRDKSCIEDITARELTQTMIVLNASNEFSRQIIENKLDHLVTTALQEASGKDLMYVIKIVQPTNQPAHQPVRQAQQTQQTPQTQATQNIQHVQRVQQPNFNDVIAHFDSESNQSESNKPSNSNEPEQARGFHEKVHENPGFQTSADAIALATNSSVTPLHTSSKVTRDESTHLNTSATFDTFVPGDSNRFAKAAALAAAETPGKTFNPLCIYGDSGLGKTHLLNAIGNYIIQQNPSAKVLYANAEEFMNEFINALAGGAQRQESVALFNEKYRNVDVLLIDDIQFLGNGPSTMEQFFHTFNALHEKNKQIVIASDVAPKNLKGFEARLISRFDSGLSVDIKPPDRETRVAILRLKVASGSIVVPNEVLDLIADQVTDNIRELEGALTRVTAMASLNNQPITRTLAEQTLQDFFTTDIEITPTDIITSVAKYFKLTFDDLVGPGRTKNVAMARQIAMYMAREMTSMSLVDVGEIFGGRDHSTVMHACRKITSEMSEKREIYNYVNELTVHLKQHGSADM